MNAKNMIVRLEARETTLKKVLEQRVQVHARLGQAIQQTRGALAEVGEMLKALRTVPETPGADMTPATSEKTAPQAAEKKAPAA